jgi:hypothetical protein
MTGCQVYGISRSELKQGLPRQPPRAVDLFTSPVIRCGQSRHSAPTLAVIRQLRRLSSDADVDTQLRGLPTAATPG